MTKKEIARIANKLGWEFEETKEAVEKLLKEESIIEDWKEFFKICIEAKGARERWKKVYDRICKQLAKKDLVETICKWLYVPDPSLSVCSLFNMADDRESSFASNYQWSVFKLLKSFTPFIAPVVDKPPVDPESISDHFISRLIRERKDRYSIFEEVIAKMAFMAFNITAFREMVTSFAINPQESPRVKELVSVLSEGYLPNTRKFNRERKHWLYYLLVEKLKEEYGLRGAFREVAKRLSEHIATIRFKYSERKKIAKKKGLSHEEIISEYYLRPSLEKYLKSKDVSESVSK